jgi:sodium-dependent dicarboxylate transporter 2/3/5
MATSSAQSRYTPAAVLLAPLLLWLWLAFTPAGASFSWMEQRVAALFVFAALAWILEPWPTYATSMLIITLELALLSDSGLAALMPAQDEVKPLPYHDIMATLASPVIQLFLGGFFLAAAATKYRLDQNLARVLLAPFGQKPTQVMLGIMIVTATFSMFMSNTATTAMMLAILLPLLNELPANDRGRTALALAVPFAANLGGLGTPIGSPPNAIALKYLTGAHALNFGQWMAFGLPFVLVMVTAGWLLLKTLFPFEQQSLTLRIKGAFLKTPRARIVYATFIATILLWLTDFWHGMNAYVVAMIPVAVFLTTKVINKEDLKTLNWEILWLVAGGIALGMATEVSGLAAHLIRIAPLGGLPGWALLLLAVATAIIVANFLSHTATANLLLPIVAALSASLPAVAQIGGSPAIILAVTLSISTGMCLPISSPPNALASATGQVSTPDMARAGLWIAGLGLALASATVTRLRWLNFFN